MTDSVGRLYDRYGADLYRYAVMLLADPDAAADAVQQVFLALVRTPRELEHDDRYLRRAVRNECYSMLRVRTREAPVERPILEPAAATVDPTMRVALERAIRSLSPEQREVLHLKAFEGFTFREIADITGESINTIASRYRYAIDKLRVLM